MARVLLSVALLLAAALACTNILVTPGASQDGSTFLTYNADWDGVYGYLYFSPHATWPANATVDVIDWESTWGDPSQQRYLGTIDQVPETYNVVGNMNEYQVAMGETTFFGIDELTEQKGAIIDYGSLIYLTLQRSKTAREAIKVMDGLVQKYGYYSAGESFSIVDPKEAWVVELISKGNFEFGAVWVAARVPDGYVCSHANQARIRTFRRDDPENYMYSTDVVSFAKAHGYYPASAADEDFSFSDVYCPVTARSARADESRVWSVFRHVAGASAMDEYTDYILGKNTSHRMPLWVKPTKKLSLNDTMMLMRDHFEGTVLSFTSDVGAQAFSMPYRWHPLTWKYQGHTYFNERSIATQQTGWGMVAQARSWTPAELGGINWFTMDDTSCSAYFPAYTVTSRIPASYTGGSIYQADLQKAYWVFNLVANHAYSRWSTIYPTVFAKIQDVEKRFIGQVPDVDKKAAELLRSSRAKAVEYLSQFTETTGQSLVQEWGNFFLQNQARFRDGNVLVKPMPVPTFPGYPQPWLKRIVEEDGDRYRCPDEDVRDRFHRYF